MLTGSDDRTVISGMATAALTETDAMLKEISSVPSKLFAFEGAPCFAKGTLVHTKEGLVPIEKIKVGDWVLSKPEDGSGEVEYKRVTQTFAHAPTQIINLWYHFKEERNQFSKLTTTLNHPFWVVGRGWTEVSALDLWPGKESQLELLDGRRMLSTARNFIFKTSVPHIGWISKVGSLTDEIGTEWDFENNVIYRRDVTAEDFIEDFGKPYELMPDHPNLFTAPVYNIEVEDFHTYFVGKEGVWAHNKNPATALMVNNGGPALPDGMTKFFDPQELKAYVIQHNIKDGFLIIRAGDNSQVAYLSKIPPLLKFEDLVRVERTPARKWLEIRPSSPR